jgi:hypothetical protein
MKIISRSEALVTGVLRYYTGKPCKHGHVAERLTSCGRCLTCHRITKEKFLKTEAGKRMKQRWDRKNIQKRRVQFRQRVNAIPKWADTKAVAQFYRECPEGFHVDHIIPLRNPDICGLHTLENLQYLPADENRRKGNSVETVSLEAIVCPIKV